MAMESVGAEKRPYHHGNLRQALLEEAEAILEQDGIQALTLRAVARAAGVSHAAPTNHFGDLAGLLSELAAVGFRRFIVMLRTAAAVVGDDPVARARAMDRAYVDFARTHTGMFLLIFRKEQLDPAWPALREAGREAMDLLRETAIAAAPEKARDARWLATRMAARWSLVHGFALLAIDQRLDPILMNTPDIDVDDLLEMIQQKTLFDD
jgi:AcrR family transcriptional regulator